MVLGLLWAGRVGLRYVRATGVLLQVVQAPDPTGITQWLRPRIMERDQVLNIEGHTIAARLYAPVGVASPPGLVLLHGVHQHGIGERNLVRFARALAGAGLSVLTPELPELLAYRVEPQTVSRITTAANAHAHRLSRTRVGVIGISFAGGLALLAAAQDPEPFAFVMAVGAHHDLARLARYYAGVPVRGPNGQAPSVSAHPYGARIIVRAHAERFFGPTDVEQAQHALGLWLSGRHREARHAATALSPPGHALMTRLFDERRLPEIKDLFLRAVEGAAAELAEVSPRGKLAGLRTPVFLVHGSDDPVIPSLETRWLAQEVPQHALRRAVVSPALRHTELSAEPNTADHWQLVDLVAAMLAAAD